MMGWIVQNPTLIQILPSLVPMVFNTALSFAALSLGILFSETRNKIVSKITAGVVVFFSLSVLIQYLFEKNFGIDSFFVEPFYALGTSSPGRMAVSTAICFLLTSLMVLFKKEGYSRAILGVAVPSMVIGFSVIGLMGYFFGFNAEYGWGSFSGMAVHTAGSFILLSLAYLWQLRLAVRRWSVHRGVLVPFYVVIVGILTSILIWQLLVVRDLDRNRSITEIRAEAVKANLDNVFVPLKKALQHMGRRFKARAYPNYKIWLIDAESYFEDFKGMRALVWADENQLVKWSYSAGFTGEEKIDANLSRQDILELSRASSSQEPRITRIFEIKDGGRGFIFLAPVFDGDKFLGSISAVVLAEPFFFRVIRVQGYDLKLLEDGKEIYSVGSSDSVFARDWKSVSDYVTAGARWKISLVPKPEIVRNNTSALPGIVLLFGVSISVLLGISLGFYNRSRFSEKAAQEAFKIKEDSMNAVPLMIITMDKDTVIREMNATAVGVLGYSNEEVVGKTTSIIFNDAVEVREFHNKIEKEIGHSVNFGAEYMQALFSLGYNKACEWTLIKKSGERFSAVISASEIRDASGTLTGYLVVMEDVSDRKEKERLLKEQEQKILASSRLACLGEMAAGIAHEINNPLAIIGGHASMLRKVLQQKGFGDDVDLMRKVDAIDQTIHRVAKIIKGLRSYARDSESGGEETIRVESLVEDTLAFCLDRFRSEGVELTRSIEPGLTVHVRPYQISQVLLNLLNNALDAVISSRVKNITLQVQARDGGVEISVSDTGPGVPYHLRGKIMEPFFTTKEVGKGMGLGLSISQGIIQSHNGKLYLDQNSAKTRFVIWLPV